MEKILNFYKEHDIFLSIDHELCFIPDMRIYVTRENIVSSRELGSDTKNPLFEIEP